VLRAFSSQAARAELDLSSASPSVLVLFPDWCVACRKRMKTLAEPAPANRNMPLHIEGLVFADESVVAGQDAHDENFKQLAGTQTYEVPATTAQDFGATDYPLGIVLDTTRTIRFIGVLPSTAFDQGGYIAKVLANLSKPLHGAIERTRN
jgi:thiol-disulfide isomerase/thioredoxin